MTLTTGTNYGAQFSDTVHHNAILEYLSGGNYGPDQENALADALMAAFADEVDARLPDGVTWHPSTSEFIHPYDFDMPDEEVMRLLFEEAWNNVVARYADIEGATFPGPASS